MVFRPRRAPVVLQHSFVLTILLLAVFCWKLSTVAVTAPPTPAQKQAAADERAVQQACALPRTALAWRAPGAPPQFDLCQATADERARWRAALAAGGAPSTGRLHFLNGAVALENGAPVWWASGGATGLWRGAAADWRNVSTEATDFVAVTPHAVYALRQGWRLDRSLDGGASFTTLAPHLAEPDDDQRLAVAPLLINPHETAQLWTGGRALWRSLDGGEHWAAVSAPVTGSADNRVSALALAPPRAGEPGSLLAGTREGWLQRFVLGAASSTPGDAVLPRRGFVSALAFAPHEGRVVYAAYATLGGPHVWRSADGGATWRALDGVGATALPDLPVNALAPDPNVAGRLFVGTDAGVFVTDEDGASWSLVWAGPQVTALQITDGGQHLHVFGNDQQGADVWTAELTPPSVAQQPPPQQPQCVAQLTPAVLLAPAAGARQTIELQALASCAWTATPVEDWLTIVGAASGQGKGSVTINVSNYTASTPRFGTVNIGGRVLAVAQQSALNNCQTLPLRAGETVTGNLNADDCFLNLGGQTVYYADQYRFEGRAGELLTVLAQSLTSNVRISYHIIAPDGQSAALLPLGNGREQAALTMTGAYTLRIFGAEPQQTLNYRLALQLLTPGCDSFAVTALDRAFAAAGGGGRVQVSAAGNCSWQVFTSAPWLTLTNASGRGSAQLEFKAAENVGTTARTGYLEVGGKRALIAQAGRSGECAPQPLTPHQPVNGSLTPGDCPLQINANSSASNADQYVFRGRAGERLIAEVTPPLRTTARLYLLNARGELLAQGDNRLPQAGGRFTLPEEGFYTLAVTAYQPSLDYALLLQLQPADCVYAVAPEFLTAPASGGPVTVQLQTGAHCPWFLQPVSGAEWLPLEAGLNGVGPRALTLNVPANRTPQPRTAPLALGGQYWQIFQPSVTSNCAATPLTPGQPVQGVLMSADCPSQLQPLAGTPEFFQVVADRFTFNGAAGQVFSFLPTTVSNHPSFPATVIAPIRYGLLDPQGKLVAAGQTDPHLPPPSFILPSTGSYLFELASSPRLQYFDYVLTINLSAAGCATHATVSATRFEATGGSGSVQIEAPPGCAWQVQAATGARQFTFAERTQGVGRGQVRFTFEPNPTGTATTVVLRVGQQSFQLAQAGQGGSCQARPLPFGQFVSGRLSLADCPLPAAWPNGNTQRGQRYAFTANAGEQIALSSPRLAPPTFGGALAPVVSLYDPDGRLLNNDSAARALGGQYLLSKTGVYTVEITLAPNNSANGFTYEYQLLLERLTASCLYTANAGLQRFGAAGGNGSFALVTGGQCQWTPRSNALWVRLHNPAASGAVSFTVEANPAPEARTAALVAGGQVIEIEQAGAGGACAITPLLANQPVTGALTPGACRARVGQGLADLYALTLRTNDRWRLRASSALNYLPVNFVLLDAEWRIIWQPNGTFGPPLNWFTLPPGVYYLQVSSGLELVRTPYTLTLDLEAGACGYTVLQNGTRFFGAGGAGTLTMLTAPGCPWTASTQFDWLTLNPSSGSGPATITYRVQPFELINGTRQGWLDVAQQRFTILQTSAPAPENCEPAPLAFGQAVNGMLGPTDCTAQFLPQAENSRADRFAFTARAGQQFAVEVANGAALTLTLYDAAQRIIAQTSGDRLPARASSNAPPFLVLPDNQTYFLELAFPSIQQTFNYTLRLVTPASCAYTLAQTAPTAPQPLPAAGGKGALQIITAPGCAWELSKYPAPWLSFSGATSGAGPGAVEFHLAANETEHFRFAGIALGANQPLIYVGQLGQGGGCTTRQLTAGETVRGNLKPGDCPVAPGITNPAGLPYPATAPQHRFTFTATAGAQLVVRQQQRPNLQADQFTLLDPRGQVLTPAGADAIPPQSGLQPPARLTLTSNGAYTLGYSGLPGPYEFTLDLTAGECGFVLESVQAQMSSAGGSGTANVRTQSNCSWTAYATEPWITLSQNSGQGDGVIAFTVAPNHESDHTRTRLGAIRLAGRALPIVQAGRGGSCAPTPINAGQSLAGELTARACLRLNAAQQPTAQYVERYSFTARAGEQAQVKVISNGALGVQIVPLSALQLSSAVSGNYVLRQPTDWFGTASLTLPADGVYVIEVLTNNVAYERLPYTIHLQVNAPGCGVALSETERQFGAEAGQGAFNVTAAAGCRWQVYAVDDWIAVNGERERRGADAVSYSLSANPTAQARWGALSAGGQIYLIEQAGAGGGGSCATGTIAAGQTVFGQLSLADCRPRANDAALLVADRYSFSGGAGERIQFIARLAQAAPWLPVLTLFDANGAALAQFSAASLAPPAHARLPQDSDFFTLPATGQYVIELALRQAAAATPPSVAYALSLTSAPPACSYSATAGPLRFDAQGGGGALNVAANGSCTWTALITESWLAVAAAPQTGGGSVAFTVAPNPGQQARRGLLLVGGRSFVIEQAGGAGHCLAQPLTPGQALTGRLDEQDCPGQTAPQTDWPNSSFPLFIERFSFAAQANDRLLFTLAANSSSSVQIRLLGPSGGQLLTGAEGRLPALNDRFVLPAAGAYEIEISSTQAVSYTALLLLGSGACQFGVNPRQLQFEAAGGASTLTINASAAACAWRAVSSAPWLTFDSQNAGALTLRAAANEGAAARSTTLAVGDSLVLVEQAGAGARCAPPLLVRNQISNGKWDNGDCGNQFRTSYGALQYQDRYTFPAAAGDRLSLTLQTSATFPRLELYDEQGRFVASGARRLPEGAGEFLLPAAGVYTVRASATEATAYSLLASDSRTCTFTLTPNPLLAPSAGGKRGILVTASQPGCAWSARSSVNWLSLPASDGPGLSTIFAAQLFSGARPFEITVAPNEGAPRTGYLWLADQIIAVQQDARSNTPVAEPLVCVNAATFARSSLAPDLLVSAFGARLATETRAANGLVYNLGGTTVTITDRWQVKREAYLLFVSPTQVNFVVPAGTALGPATVAVTSGDGFVTSCTLTIAAVAPGLFSANASGSGWAGGLLLRVRSDRSQTYEPLTRYDPALNRFVALPITVNEPGETVYLILFGTGLRGRSELAALNARSGATALPVNYCGPVNQMLGLDQVNLALPASLAGSGEATVELNVDGQAANLLRIYVR